MEPMQGYRSIAIDCSQVEWVEFAVEVSKPHTKRFVMLYVVIALFFLLISFLMPFEMLISFQNITLVLAFIYLLSASIRKWQISKHLATVYDKSNSLWIRRAYTLDNDGVRVEGHDGSNSFTPWKSIISVTESQTGLYLMLSAQLAIIVPMRGFPTELEYEKFAQHAKDKVTEVRSGQKESEPIPVPTLLNRISN